MPQVVMVLGFLNLLCGDLPNENYLHTPEGIIEVDSDTVTDEELAELGMTREALNELLPKPERAYGAEIDEIKVRLNAAGI